MTTYVVRRLLQFVVILFGLSIFFFVLLHLQPGGPCQIQPSQDPAAHQHYLNCVKRLGLDRSLPQQYVTTMGGYIHGNFGTSNNGFPVTQLILGALPVTFWLAMSSYTIQLLIALPLGIFSSLKQYSVFDVLFTFVSYIGLSTPTFFVGLLLLFIAGVDLHWLPVGQVVTPFGPGFLSSGWYSNLAHDPIGTLGDYVHHLIGPAITLMFVGIAGDSRFMRASMLDVIHQDYIRTARAKGVRRRTVIFKHALRNAILPIITNVALFLPTLVGGFIITESIWSYYGVGFLFLSSLGIQDYTIVQALLMLSAAAVLVANLLADLVYAWVDPRIRYD
jgi:peptide/nickel transport system permease protein